MKNFLILFSICLVGFNHIFAQINVSGVISDENDGSAVPGVNIVLKGTAHGTMTDLNGQFSIEVPDSQSVLQITFVGYQSVEVIAADAIEIFGGTYNKKKKHKKTEQETGQIKDTIPQADHKKALRKYLGSLEEGKTCSPFMYAYSDNEDDRANLPLKATLVDVKIVGIIADVIVKQVYVNKSPEVIEAVYVFPGSSQSAVYAMNMQIGKRTLVARIKEKEEARAIYEQAKSEGKTASLLEQHRPNVFQMDVANILPGDSIVVEFRYTETVTSLNGEYSFVFPRIVGPRYAKTNEKWLSQVKSQEGAAIDFDIAINILSPIPIKEISADSLKIDVLQEDRRKARITLDDSEKQLNKSDILVKYRLRGDKVESGILTYEHNDENFFLLMMEPPKKVRKEQVPPREYIIIMDVSGSMNGYPIKTSKTLLKKLSESFDSTDVFNIVQFAAGSKAFRHKSVPATKANLSDAFEFIDRPAGSGGTELLAGLKTAFNLRADSGYSTTFIIATDGYVDVESEALNFIRQNLNSANVFCFGIGSSVNHFIIEGIAYAGMGEEYVVTNANEAEKIADGLIEQIKFPVLTDIQTSFEGVEIYDTEPAVLHDVFSNRPIILCGKYKGKAEGKIKISGKSGRRHIQESFKLKKGKENTALRYLWARNRIKYLSDYAFYFEEPGMYKTISPARKQKIIDLGLKYNLLTNFTSFVAVDTIARKETTTSQSGNEKSIPSQHEYNPTNIKIRGYASPNIYGNTIGLSGMSVGLDELVVVGYGTVTKKEVLSAIASVSENDLLLSGIFPGHSLRNMATGVDILRGDNVFGGISHFSVNGQNSILRNSYPAIMLNNVGIQQSIFADNYLINSNYHNNILPIDPLFIGSINIAKSSFAHYAQENADNGVVSVNITRSSNSKYILFNTSYSFDKVGNLPDGIANDQKSLLQNGFTLKNSFMASYIKSKWSFNMMASNTNQKSFVPGMFSNTNNLGLNGRFDISENIKAKADLFWINQHINSLARYAANSGLLYSMMNATPDQTGLFIKNSLSDYNQNILIPSFELDYNIAGNGAFQLKYFASANLRNAERNEQFKPGYLPYSEGSSCFVKNHLQSISHRPGFYFNNNYSDHVIDASVSMNFTNIEETHLLNAQYGRETYLSDYEYKENYNKNEFSTTAGYSFRSEWLFKTAYTHIYNETFSDLINGTNQISVSVGWAYDNSSLFRNIDWISRGKIAFGYDNSESTPPIFIDPAMVLAENLSASDVLFTSNLYKASYVENLKPEKRQKFTFIHSIGFFQDRLSLNVELYRSKTCNMFVPIDISTQLIGNDGEIISKGINADVSFNNSVMDWRFNQRLIYSINRSEVQNLSNSQGIVLAGIDGVKSYAINNQPYGLLITESGETANPNPDWSLAYNGNLSWRDLSLSIIAEWRQGGALWNASTALFEDATWFKLSQIQLNYSLPGNLSTKLKMKTISVYLFADNIFTVSKYSGVSPDTHFFGNINSIGIDYYNMPDTKKIGAGLKIKF